MPDTFKTEFEKYIIFHRGVAAANIGSDGHLIITYQDGSTQDLGNVDGNQKAAEAETRIAAVEDKLDAIEPKAQSAENSLREIQETYEDLRSQMNEIDTIKNDIDAQAENVEKNVAAQLRSTLEEYVSGIVPVYETNNNGDYIYETDENGNTQKKIKGYAVAFNDYALTTEVDSLIKSIQGVTENTTGNGYSLSFDKTQANSLLQDIYAELKTKGILEVDENNNYYVSRNDPISDEEINNIFTTGKGG